MKKDLTKMVIGTLLISMLATPINGEYAIEVNKEYSNVTNEYSKEQRKDKYVWEYKRINGVLYKRLFNLTTGQSIGDWIEV